MDSRRGPPELGYALTLAPLVVDNKVIVVQPEVNMVFEALLPPSMMLSPVMKSGNSTLSPVLVSPVLSPGRIPEQEAWKIGGGSIWQTGSYDSDLNLTYWEWVIPALTGTVIHDQETTSIPSR